MDDMYPLLPPNEAKNILDKKAVIYLGDVIQFFCSSTRVLTHTPVGLITRRAHL